MSMSGLLFAMSAPAMALTMMAHPVVQRAADRMLPPVATIATPGPVALQPVAFRVTVAVRAERSVAPAQPANVGGASIGKESLKPRKLMRDGCEGAISSLAGPEARRMIPGRCIA